MNLSVWPRGLSVAAVTDDNLPPRMTRLTFHGPLSEGRAARIVARLARTSPATVLDLGCGWGELMLRVLEAVPGAVGTGIDVSGADLARGRDSAAARGLAGRASFVEESAVGTARGPADLVLCVGSTHVLSADRPPRHTVSALHALRRLVSPGGRVLLGEGFWEHPPSPAEIAAMWPGTTAGEYRDLAGLVGLAVSAGFRPEWIETANLEEWDDFESGVAADTEEWLASHPGHPLAAETRLNLLGLFNDTGQGMIQGQFLDIHSTNLNSLEIAPERIFPAKAGAEFACFTLAVPLAQGQTISASDITRIRGDMSSLPSGVITEEAQVVGRVANMSLRAGTPLRMDAIRNQRVVQQGQSVRVVSIGPGFQISTEARAMTNANEGQMAQARTPAGQVVSGIAKAGGILEINY